jgi:ABC-type branched-subunit amino acid transport system ATPase component
MTMLEVKKLCKSFGGLSAINDLDLDIFESEILGVIGPNGAGKTTLFNVISGYHTPSSGRVIFNGHDITGLKAHQVAHKGISRTFQLSNLFMSLSVLNNVFTCQHMNYRTAIWERFFHTRSAMKEEKRLRQNALEILEFMGMDPLKDELAAQLTHGWQKILGICMALATNPKLLLLDEPVTGMNPAEIQAMVELISKMRERGITIAIVEHNMQAVMNLCDRVIVLNYGKKIAEGAHEEIIENKEVIEAYLGEDEEE